MTHRAKAAELLHRECTTQLKTGLSALKRDVAASIRLCSRDFGVLGQELLNALIQTQQREDAMLTALEHERKGRYKLQTQLVDLQGNFRVLCRMRPLLPHEQSDEKNQQRRVQVESNQDVHIYSPLDGSLYKSFSFQRVFPEQSTQQHVFKEIVPLVLSAVDGHHSCVFAYGQSGAGKTHTMQGTENDRGMYFRAAELVYEMIHEQQDLYDVVVSLQMVEIYNEEIYDLLSSSGGAGGHSPTQQAYASGTSVFGSAVGHPSTSAPTIGPPPSTRPVLEIRHGEQGVYLRNITSRPVTSAQEVCDVIEKAHAANKNDDTSGRSHSVVMLDIERTRKVTGEQDRGRLVLVDLAGSERLSKTENTMGQRLREAQHIHKSLSAIVDVAAAILAKDKHVPYRNSKLTHMLQDSLGGTCNRTLMVVHVNPTNADVNETINSLKFASRISHAQNGSTRRNERVEINRLNGIVSSQTSQLQALQEKLAAELELRKKFEKRLEEYRQEEHKRKAREEESKKLLYQTPSSLTSGQSSTPEQPFTTRRWSMYTRKEDRSRSALNNANNARGLNGQENIDENILRSRIPSLTSCPEGFSTSVQGGVSTPMRRTRRLSLMQNEKKSGFSPFPPPAPQSATKRKTATVDEIRSILKKRRGSVESQVSSSSGVQSKQVSFDLPSTPTEPSSHISTSNRVPVKPKSLSLPPRKPTSALRTPMTASRVPTPATRVRTSIGSGFIVPASRVLSTPSRPKPKWNGGWR